MLRLLAGALLASAISVLCSPIDPAVGTDTSSLSLLSNPALRGALLRPPNLPLSGLKEPLSACPEAPFLFEPVQHSGIFINFTRYGDPIPWTSGRQVMYMHHPTPQPTTSLPPEKKRGPNKHAIGPMPPNISSEKYALHGMVKESSVQADIIGLSRAFYFRFIRSRRRLVPCWRFM